MYNANTLNQTTCKLRVFRVGALNNKPVINVGIFSKSVNLRGDSTDFIDINLDIFMITHPVHNYVTCLSFQINCSVNCYMNTTQLNYSFTEERL